MRMYVISLCVLSMFNVFKDQRLHAIGGAAISHVMANTGGNFYSTKKQTHIVIDTRDSRHAYI